MKKVLLTVLALIVVLGLFAAAGFTGYRVGYARGLQGTANGDAPRPELRRFDDSGPREMPMHNFGFERGFQRGFGRGDFPMMGFGFFSPFTFIGRIAVLALVIWFVYWLAARSGWRLTRQTTESVPPKTESE